MGIEKNEGGTKDTIKQKEENEEVNNTEEDDGNSIESLFDNDSLIDMSNLSSNYSSSSCSSSSSVHDLDSHSETKRNKKESGKVEKENNLRKNRHGDSRSKERRNRKRNRSKDRGKDKDKRKRNSTHRSRSRSRDYKRNKHRRANKSISKSRSYDKYSYKNKDIDKHNHRNRDRYHRSRDRDRDRSKERIRGRGRGRDRDRSKERIRDRENYRYRSKERERDRKSRDRERRSRERKRSRSKENLPVYEHHDMISGFQRKSPNYYKSGRRNSLEKDRRKEKEYSRNSIEKFNDGQEYRDKDFGSNIYHMRKEKGRDKIDKYETEGYTKNHNIPCKTDLNKTSDYERVNKDMNKYEAEEGEEDLGELSETELMKKIIGITQFDTTENKCHKDTDVFGVNKRTKRKYRQYMNRRGGFNRPLSPTY